MLKRAVFATLLAALVACGGAPKPIPPPQIAPPTPAQPVADATPAASPDEAPLPLWSEVKRGVLPNGLTYYIAPAHKPEKRAFLWLAVNAGSILEDADQRGLAHFDEHMAFNGTAHFPHADIVNFVQSIGMRFGADLNAFTDFDETVYQLEVPTDKPELVGKGLDVLRDWAGAVTYDPKEVEAERGVVREEWRLRTGAGQRLRDKQNQVLFKDSPYATDIIGDVNIIDHAARDVLYRFYKDWYRPDLMAVIVVGEVDPAQIQAEIEKRFGDLKNPEHERARVKGAFPKTGATRVTIETDKEATSTSVVVYNLVPVRSRATRKDARRMLVEQLYAAILGDRYEALRRKGDAPFLGAGAGVQTLVREVDAFVRRALSKEGKADETLRALLVEVARVERHGFTQTELDRARENLGRSLETLATTAPTRESRSIADEISRNFLAHEFMIGGVAESKLDLGLLPTVTLDELNSLARSFGGPENRVIQIAAPTGAKLPTEARVLQIMDEVAKTDVPAWQDVAVPTTLMAKPPAPGKIVKETTNGKIGTTEWTLSNGAHVILKPSDYEADSIELEATSPGGLATVNDKDFDSAKWADQLVTIGGIADFDADTLRKVLTGKQVQVTTATQETTEEVSAHSTKKDLETMFQLLYLRLTAPRKDAAQVEIWRQAIGEQLANLSRDPTFQYQRDLADALYKHHPRKRLPTAEGIAKIDLDKALAFYQDRYGDVSDFTFVIVGSFDAPTIKPFVETYLASLPGKGRKEKEKDDGVRKVGGIVKKTWTAGQAPRATVRLDFHGDETWTRDKDRDVYILGEVLGNKLREDLREDKSGVYGVGANGHITRGPHQERTFVVQFGCDPKRVDELVNAVIADAADLAKNGADEANLEKVRQTFQRQRETQLRTNGFWSGWLATAARFGDDPALVLDTAPMLARVTSKNVQAAAKHYLDGKMLFEAVLLPDAAPAPAAAPSK